MSSYSSDLEIARNFDSIIRWTAKFFLGVMPLIDECGFNFDVNMMNSLLKSLLSGPIKKPFIIEGIDY